MTGVTWGGPGTARPASLARYVAGVSVTVAAVVSQYFVPELVPASRLLYGNLAGSLAIVYGIPVLAFAALVGLGPLRAWRDRMGVAAWHGLGWYGALSVLGVVLTVVLVAIYRGVDPSALSLLTRPNPAIQQAESDPWFFVGLSFVVGAFEETIFRGWIFGYWKDRPGSWLVPATWTSAVFAGVHLYYGLTYGAISPVFYTLLFLLGFAFAAAYRFSGGNLVVPALLHGAHDAAGYLGLISPEAGVVALYAVILLGFLLAIVEFFRAKGDPLAPIGPPVPPVP
jgi:membrane protease YdiL (CAAX protease family)